MYYNITILVLFQSPGRRVMNEHGEKVSLTHLFKNSCMAVLSCAWVRITMHGCAYLCMAAHSCAYTWLRIGVVVAQSAKID